MTETRIPYLEQHPYTALAITRSPCAFQGQGDDRRTYAVTFIRAGQVRRRDDTLADWLIPATTLQDAARAAGAENVAMAKAFIPFLSLRLLLLCCLSFIGTAHALDIVPYQEAAFSRARAAGQVTVLQFHSGWCPVCVMQERGVKALADDKALEQVVVFQADFFKEEALRKRFNVNSFSTLVFFKGDMERARTTGDFRPEQLRQFFAKAL